jgi:hypothetical protein
MVWVSVWGSVVAAILASSVFVWRHFGALTPRWNDAAIGALVASGFIALFSVVVTALREWTKQPNVAALKVSVDTPTLQTPESVPLPTAIGPNDRKLIIEHLTKFGNFQTAAKLAPFKARVMYVPSGTTSYLAEELYSIISEAGWTLMDNAPQKYTADTSKMATGISIWSSYTDPAQVAGIYISQAFNQVGIKHKHYRHVDLRHQDFCMVLILPN